MLFDRPLIAIDIGSSSIKLVEMTGKSKKQLKAIGLEVLPPGLVTNGVVQDEDQLINIIRELLKKLKITPNYRRAAISLGGGAVIIKRIKMARTQDADFDEQVFYEAEQHLQQDMAELYFRYYELPTSSTKEEAHLILVGARREAVEQHISIIRSVGMRIGVVDCDAFASYNMFEYNYGIADQMIAIANLGSTSTQVSLVAGGEYLFSREIPIGGEQYTTRICEELDVDRDNAETLKVAASQGDGAAPERLGQVIDDLNEQLINEIRITIDYYFQSGEAPIELNEVSFFFLSGGSSKLSNLDTSLSASLGIPVQILNPFHRVGVHSGKFNADYLLMQGHLYGVAVGLGLRAMNDVAL